MCFKCYLACVLAARILMCFMCFVGTITLVFSFCVVVDMIHYFLHSFIVLPATPNVSEVVSSKSVFRDVAGFLGLLEKRVQRKVERVEWSAERG